jgi:hypothetical protein
MAASFSSKCFRPANKENSVNMATLCTIVNFSIKIYLILLDSLQNMGNFEQHVNGVAQSSLHIAREGNVVVILKLT